MPPDRFIKIGLNIGATSKLYRRSEVGCLDSKWRRNGLTVNLPNDPAVGCSGAVTMIGLAVDINGRDEPDYGRPLSRALESLTTRVTVDTVSARLLRTIFSDAELHGCSDAFFDAGIDVLLRRLSCELAHVRERKTSPLENRQLSLVQDLIEAHLDTGLSVRDMAASVGMDQTHFAKRFVSSTGLAPFAYLTSRRMERAKAMLGPSQKVIDVAQAVGYANPSKFAAAFRRYTGLSPRTWSEQAPARSSG